MISIFDIFKVGIGPSSSHTVGPMKAAAAFAAALLQEGFNEDTARIVVETYGSLALTGQGHGTFDALLLGLEGSLPHDIPLADIPERLRRIRNDRVLYLNGREIGFDVAADIQVHGDKVLPKHPNGLCFTAQNADGMVLKKQVYYSVGGGFIVTEEAFGEETGVQAEVPYPYASCAELLAQCRLNQLNISEVVLANEAALAGCSEAEVRRRVAEIADVMEACIKRGLGGDGELPGGLNVRRRAPQLAAKLRVLRASEIVNTQLWPMVYAMAVNEENASGGRVVTAPTNGAAGIIPAVLYYFRKFNPHANQERVEDFLLTAGAIGILYKTNASISGADVGCQGEVGVACSMAAGAYAEVIGGTPKQVENAAEMAMEHHLGLTCDPVGGLVQIPCIERNGIAAEKALKLGTLALLEDGMDKKVSLDEVIQTMLQTGRDMKATYKETSLAGLAVTLQKKAVPVSVRVVEC
ncbi:L-serine ammonia-lyase [Neisseria animalis]|uniref:L-serine dehydratase n=1 Tax=Neisseria animalis TaxID=492 RepID=A0A5P3MTC9_NEIAN|nr:L-serine ammonia-lyase [Neisseria animalis]QEY24335.1 L-serine ammonia-lyase [Neisseria animalis]ROW32264.1 L-serine ammonia-lyase [Neisseria animalis]VEE06810.1 L-serine dehydratase [Neisseria animalis]